MLTTPHPPPSPCLNPPANHDMDHIHWISGQFDNWWEIIVVVLQRKHKSIIINIELHDDNYVKLNIRSVHLCWPPKGVVEDGFLGPQSIWPSSSSQEVVVVEQGKDVLRAVLKGFDIKRWIKPDRFEQNICWCLGQAAIGLGWFPLSRPMLEPGVRIQKLEENIGIKIKW